MGFIEETGAAQHLRDARITTIYEGTTGIQANDLVGRKIARDAGAVAKTIAAEVDKVAARLAARKEPALQAIGRAACRRHVGRAGAPSNGSFPHSASSRASRMPAR